MGKSMKLFQIAMIIAFCSSSALASRIRDEEIPQNIQYIFKGNISRWEPPREFSLKYPYYLSGYDEENRPVWILELGRWDIKGAIEAGGEVTEMFDKYVDKGIYNVLSSVGERDPDNENDPKEAIGIIDLDGYNFEQLNSISAVTYILRVIRMILAAAKFVNSIYIVNTNFVAQTILNVIRPVAGKEFELVEVYGTDSSKWRPILKRKIPLDQLPEWYGGSSKDFKPVRVYG